MSYRDPLPWKAANNLLIGLMTAALLYWIAAAESFLWRNPKANQMQLMRHLPAVLRFEKIDRFQ